MGEDFEIDTCMPLLAPLLRVVLYILGWATSVLGVICKFLEDHGETDALTTLGIVGMRTIIWVVCS